MNEDPESGENQTTPGYSADINIDRGNGPEEQINDLLQTLRHLVGSRPVAMLDWPSYVNSGDHLIWLGEKVLFKNRLGCKVLYECSLHQFDFLAVSRLPSDAVVVMHGGGNFGDIYDQHERFREAMAAAFSDRRIIFMPQTVHFTSQQHLEDSARRLRAHPDLHVMARDRKSLEIIRSQMGLTNCYLRIDSAFALQPTVTALQKHFSLNAERDAVYLLRGDTERTGEISPPAGAARYDWARTYDLDPFAKGPPSPESMGLEAASFEGGLDTVSWGRLCSVVRMLSTGQRIVTDRLHGHILAIMMKKQHELYDNNYGKNRSFYQTWTSTNPLVTFVGPGETAERVVETPPGAEIDHAAKMVNSSDELFLDLLRGARQKEELFRRDDEVIAAYTEATTACPTRAEALHGAARFCRNRQFFERGYEFAARGLAIAYPKDAKALESWIYDYGLLDELAVNAYWIGKYAECVDACDRLLSEDKLPAKMRERVAKNKQLAMDKLADSQVSGGI